ncbi:MAG: LCP family protein [Candidatus Moranbacteria bacterium]|nr:LCP family protein [Candidatus Moranbacteria bacterium]
MENPNRQNNKNYGSRDFADAEDVFAAGVKNRPAGEKPGFRQKNKALRYKSVLYLFAFIIIGGIAYGSFFAGKLYFLGKKVSIENNDPASFLETMRSVASKKSADLRGADTDRINILLLGVAGSDKPGKFLTDTIMVASLDLKSNRVALLSIPRDLYVQIPDAKIWTKINSVYQYGLDNLRDEKGVASQAVKKTVADITGLEIHYYAVLNFDGFEKIIDDIGGVNIMNARDIYDARYPGPNFSYETFELAKGFHQLDGATALKYARVRHNDPEGDFGRAKRQQQIMQAAKNKLFSAGTFFNVFTLDKLFETLGDNIRTDIPTEDFAGFFELTKKLDTDNINNVVVDAWNEDSLLKVSHVQYGPIRAFVLIPRVGNYGEIRELAENIFDLNKIKRRREEITQENAAIAIVNRSGDFQIINKLKKVLQDNLDYKNVTILNSPGKNITDKTVVYDSTGGQKPFTLDELATKIPASVSYAADPDISETLRDRTADMVLVIGKDMIGRYNMEEATIEDLNRSQDDQMYLNLLEK